MSKTIYNKGEFRGYERAKHLRPYLKRLGNKKWRKTGKDLPIDDTELVKKRKKRRATKTIEVKITKLSPRGKQKTRKQKYRTLRAAKNAMNQSSVIKAELIIKKNE